MLQLDERRDLRAMLNASPNFYNQSGI